MSRALWLAFGALSLGFVAASCTGSDGSADFDNTAGEGAGGDSTSTAGTSSTSGKNGTGGSNADAGAGVGASEGGHATGGVGSSGAGAPGGGGDATAGGVPGGGGDATSGGVPGGGGDATSGGALGEGGGRPGGDGGGPSDPPGVPCKNVKNCADGQVCFKEGCKLEQGVCADAEAGTPVCGCDGITYYDASLAASAGVDVGARGICSGDGAITCEGKCEEGYTCGIVGSRGATCLGKLGGVCWSLPKECPLDDAATYNVCGTEKCLSLCDAVTDGAQAVPSAQLCGGIIN
jgi:hypothetical protein